jgi:ferredoxin--NADP+ reductase
MAIGDRAKGSFTLDRGAAVHLMVATVTGIAPLRSMLRQALHEGSRARFVVLHGASRADELPYHDELAALAVGGQISYTPTVSRPTEAANAAWRGRTGRVDPLAGEVGVTLDPATTSVYACGNPGMVANVRRDLGALGFRVRSEVFD